MCSRPAPQPLCPAGPTGMLGTLTPLPTSQSPSLRGGIRLHLHRRGGEALVSGRSSRRESWHLK